MLLRYHTLSRVIEERVIWRMKAAEHPLIFKVLTEQTFTTHTSMLSRGNPNNSARRLDENMLDLHSPPLMTVEK